MDIRKKINIPNRQDTSQIDELKTEINNLPKDKPNVCEGLIRELNKKISEISNKSVKERLQSDLKAVSCLGLNSELKKMVEDNGLNMEAIQIVLKYLTTKEELGEYFFTHPNGDSEKDGLDAVRRRLRPKLEVLGALYAKGIDVKKPWVQNLVKAAPSLETLSRISVAELKELCKGENHGEAEVVKRLVKDAESRSTQRAAAQDLQGFHGKEGGGKAIDHEKLRKAKALMKEAKKMATDQADEAKKAVNGKLAEITKILQLPRDWNKQDIGIQPEQLLQQLDGIIGQFKSVVEVGEPYQSEMEVVRKASGGRALCGIYYSEYVPPVTAEVPIIVMPDKVILSSPNNSQQVRYVQFSKSQAAANYVQSVKSSSSNIGLGIGGFYKLVVGDISGSYATRSDKEKTTSGKMHTSSASVVQYIWIATKTFQIDQEHLKLNASAIKMASTTVKDMDTARLFMQRYGSHFPAGVHTLGGVLFRIVDAESKSTKATTILAAKAAHQLQGHISVGFLGGVCGIGASISGEHNSGSGKAEGHDERTDDVFYTFSSQAMGPATTNPATFNKLLANNSTWAIIDRGSPTAYIPIWEMIRETDRVFEEVAKHLEKTWRNDEEERMHRDTDTIIEEQTNKFQMEYISNISFVVRNSKVKGVRNMIKVDLNARCGRDSIYPVKHTSHNMDEAIAGLAFIQDEAFVPDGYTKIDQDLNKGAGGTCNYLCITKVGENKMTAIDFLASGEKCTETTINGYFRYEADLNTGAFPKGDYVYLLYKTNTGKAFTDVYKLRVFP